MKINIGRKILEIPIIQGGMGIGVSLGRLAGSVMNEGGMGVISAANPGYLRDDFYKRPLQANLEQLALEIKKAKTYACNKGLLAVNIMVAGTHYGEYVKQAVKNKVDAIICGAGLPLDLPALTKGSGVALAPIVSSGKAASLICRVWKKKYDVIPDFIVIEGPKAGGHLGFSKQSLMDDSAADLESLLKDVKDAVIPYEEKHEQEIPLFVAGGIFTGEDIVHYLKLGAQGVQMGTRFIGTHECDASYAFKNSFLQAKATDITLVTSPVGMPGRAIKNSFIETVERGPVPVRRCFDCLTPCQPKSTPYCISEALMNAVNGNENSGLIFTGVNGHRINELLSVKDLIGELMVDVRTYEMERVEG